MWLYRLAFIKGSYQIQPSPVVSSFNFLILSWPVDGTMDICHLQLTFQSCYDAVNFLHIPHNRHPIAHLWVWDIGCLLLVQNLVYALYFSLQCRILFCVMFCCAITTRNVYCHTVLCQFCCDGGFSCGCYFLAVRIQISWPHYMNDQHYHVIRTLHDCPSQMNENLLISNSKLTSDSELIWWR